MGENIHKGHRARVKQKFLENGAAVFQRHELLELLLYFGVPQKDTNELAHRLDTAFPTYGELFSAPFEELMRVEGMIPNAATLICLIGQLLETCEREKQLTRIWPQSRKEVREFILPYLTGAQQERVVLLCLNNLGKVLGSCVLSEGTVNATEISIRKALQQALRYNATAVILAHNHPSGHAIPSKEDVNTTMAVAKALAVADIQLVDHIIVAEDGDYTSMRETPLYAPLFTMHGGRT